MNLFEEDDFTETFFFLSKLGDERRKISPPRPRETLSARSYPTMRIFRLAACFVPALRKVFLSCSLY